MWGSERTNISRTLCYIRITHQRVGEILEYSIQVLTCYSVHLAWPDRPVVLRVSRRCVSGSTLLHTAAFYGAIPVIKVSFAHPRAHQHGPAKQKPINYNRLQNCCDTRPFFANVLIPQPQVKHPPPPPPSLDNVGQTRNDHSAAGEEWSTLVRWAGVNLANGLFLALVRSSSRRLNNFTKYLDSFATDCRIEISLDLTDSASKTLLQPRLPHCSQTNCWVLVGSNSCISWPKRSDEKELRLQVQMLAGMEVKRSLKLRGIVYNLHHYACLCLCVQMKEYGTVKTSSFSKRPV